MDKMDFLMVILWCSWSMKLSNMKSSKAMVNSDNKSLISTVGNGNIKYKPDLGRFLSISVLGSDRFMLIEDKPLEIYKKLSMIDNGNVSSESNDLTHSIPTDKVPLASKSSNLLVGISPIRRKKLKMERNDDHSNGQLDLILTEVDMKLPFSLLDEYINHRKKVNKPRQFLPDKLSHNRDRI
ncbi:hypothetical protein CHUAL_012167 [Chamberlinius hualienensis]